jgi:Sugar (and other) transporter
MCPESPAWHLKKGGRYDLAYRSLQRLRNTELQAAKELYATYLQRRAKADTVKSKVSYSRKVIELFTIARIRRATTASYVVMLSQQLCGINIIAFYSPCSPRRFSASSISSGRFPPFGQWIP